MEPTLEAPRLERRLVAILAADIEGYSRHMEQNEMATLATLSRLRVMADALIASHNGGSPGPLATASWRNSPAWWMRSIAP